VPRSRLKWGSAAADRPRVRICDSCHCPAASTRDVCPFCGATLDRAEPVAFSLEHRGSGYEWYTDDALVASATVVHGYWKLTDARGAHVVTLVGLGESGGDAEGMALLGPGARLVGSIRSHEDGSDGSSGSIASDADGRPVLVLRSDGDQAAHVVDRNGDVVAVASWEDRDGATDLLVTAIGTRHSLALVFGLLLAFEVARHSDRTL